MSLTLVKDLPRSPVNLVGEFSKLNSLYMKNTEWTTSGDASFTSPSSGILYEAITGGEVQLYGLLAVVLEEYVLSAEIFNGVVNRVANLATNADTATDGQILISNGDGTSSFISSPVKITEEVITFAESDIAITHANTKINDNRNNQNTTR